MTYPLTWLADALRGTGLTVREVAGWKTRGRPYNFDPRGSVMFHHTASNRNAGPSPALGICIFGRPDLPGPLCHLMIARDLTVYVIAAGRANHAGAGGPWKNIPIDSGNSYMIGVEVENDGRGEPWTEDLQRTIATVFATLLKHSKRRATWLIGHKEWAPTRKIDPHPIDMDAFRARTARAMNLAPAWPKVYLKRGMNHPAVKTFFAQIRKRYGSKFGPFAISPGFGPLKDRALRRFQKARGLTPDGIIGPLTWKTAWSK